MLLPLHNGVRSGGSVGESEFVCGVDLFAEALILAEASIIAECRVVFCVGDFTSEVADLVSSGGTKHLVEEESFVEETGTENTIGSLNLTGGSENKA